MAIANHKTRERELRDERALTRRVRRGDRGAFELLYASHEGRLYRFCYRLTGSSVSAAALVEATFARALADLPEDGLDTLDVAAYLYATARTLTYERNCNGGPPEAGGSGEHSREVAAANRHLSPRQRMTLVLRDLEARPDDEIALALGAEEPAVAALVARARLRLRAELHLPAAAEGCAEHLPALSAYSDGTLPPDQRPELESHVEGCAHCRAALFALREAVVRYRALPVPIPPGELRARMAAALEAVGLATLRPEAPATAETAAATGGRQTTAAAAMAALVIVGAGVTIAAWRNGGDESEPSRAPATPHPQPASSSGNATALASLGAHATPRARLTRWAPPALHHLRAGPRGAVRATPPVRPGGASAASVRATTGLSAASTSAPHAPPTPEPPPPAQTTTA
jgi:DNA-directed RNA polymerase specialized sigma24 family protein/anti-sigma factor RsiW